MATVNGQMRVNQNGSPVAGQKTWDAQTSDGLMEINSENVAGLSTINEAGTAGLMRIKVNSA